MTHRTNTRVPTAALIALGLAGLVLVGVVAFILTANRSGPEGTGAPSTASATPGASETPVASPSASDAASLEPTPAQSAAAAWTVGRVVSHDADAAMGAGFSGLHWHEASGWIAYGLQETTELGPPGVWTSGDGMAWTLAELPAGLEGYRVVDVTDAEIDGAVRFVAILTAAAASRVLVSDDGVSWEPAVTPDAPTTLKAVAHGPAGFVAVGTVASTDGRLMPGRVWQSPDGRQWTESAPTALEAASPHGIGVLGDRYVAVGFPNHPAPPLTAWVSGDGVDWQAHEVSPSRGVGCLCLTSDTGEDQMVVLGLHEEPFAALTEDGETWTEEAVGDDHFNSLGRPEILEDGAVIVAAGQTVIDGPSDFFVWVRDAGVAEWRPVDWRRELGETPAGELRLGGPGYVAAGSDRTLILLSSGTVLLTAERLP